MKHILWCNKLALTSLVDVWKYVKLLCFRVSFTFYSLHPSFPISDSDCERESQVIQKKSFFLLIRNWTMLDPKTFLAPITLLTPKSGITMLPRILSLMVPTLEPDWVKTNHPSPFSRRLLKVNEYKLLRYFVELEYYVDNYRSTYRVNITTFTILPFIFYHYLFPCFKVRKYYGNFLPSSFAMERVKQQSSLRWWPRWWWWFLPSICQHRFSFHLNSMMLLAAEWSVIRERQGRGKRRRKTLLYLNPSSPSFADWREGETFGDCCTVQSVATLPIPFIPFFRPAIWSRDCKWYET